jgi:hypothetical protein
MKGVKALDLGIEVDEMFFGPPDLLEVGRFGHLTL